MCDPISLIGLGIGLRRNVSVKRWMILTKRYTHFQKLLHWEIISFQKTEWGQGFKMFIVMFSLKFWFEWYIISLYLNNFNFWHLWADGCTRAHVKCMGNGRIQRKSRNIFTNLHKISYIFKWKPRLFISRQKVFTTTTTLWQIFKYF